MASESIQLGYWGFRGRGQIPRLLLHYTKAQWKDRLYTSQDQWQGPGKDKVSLGIPMPNLPYIIQGDFKISESRAIMNYIINISECKELLGKNLKDQATVDCFMGNLETLLSKTAGLLFDVEHYDQKRPEVTKLVAGILQNIQKQCEGKEFALGYLTLVDFGLSQLSYYIQNVFPELYEKTPCLKKIRDSFEGLEQIKQYYAQQTAIKGPFLPPVGKIKF